MFSFWAMCRENFWYFLGKVVVVVCVQAAESTGETIALGGTIAYFLRIVQKYAEPRLASGGYPFALISPIAVGSLPPTEQGPDSRQRYRAAQRMSGGDSRVSYCRDKTYRMSGLEKEKREAAMLAYIIEARAYCVVA